MQYFPIFVDLKDRHGLLIGGGEVALRKARLLDAAGARVTVIAPTIDDELQRLITERSWHCHLRPFTAADMLLSPRPTVVIAATDQPEVNAEISATAQAAGLLVNVVDAPALCNFIVPAIVDRSPLVVAISTGGRSPVLARLVREQIEASVPLRFREVAQFASDWRDRVKQALPDTAARRRFWEAVLRGPLVNLLHQGQRATADEGLQQALQHSQPITGSLHLLALGSADPDLLTLRGLQRLQAADVLFYPHHLADHWLTLSRRDALYQPYTEQSSALGLAIEQAQQGQKIVMLVEGYSLPAEYAELQQKNAELLIEWVPAAGGAC